MSQEDDPRARFGPIVDPHFHLWSLRENRYPWLQDDPPIPFRYGDYSALREHDFLPEDYRRCWDGWRVSHAVAVEAEWDRRDPVGETRWISRMAEESGLPSAFVAYAPLNAPELDTILAEHVRYPLVRGIRHKPVVSAGAIRGTSLLNDPAWQRGFGLLAQYGLHFELQAPHEFMRDAAMLFSAHPDVPVVVNHAGLPVDRSRHGLARWRRDMEELAGVDHVSIKISGLGGSNGSWECGSNRTVVQMLIDVFGVRRCMFASNYPVDSLCAGFSSIFDCFARATAEFSNEYRRFLFHDNAMRIYRIAG